MIEKIEILNPSNQPTKGCLVVLPGRGQTSEDILEFGKAVKLKNTLLVSIQPFNRAWYPMPKGADDQTDAVKGLEYATQVLDNEIQKIQRYCNLDRKEMAVCGFSAGGVMSLSIASKTKKPFAAAISCSGAILNTDDFVECHEDIKATKFLLQHNWDDLCFDWYERYLPMRRCLESKGYSLDVFESFKGHHTLSVKDAILVGEYLSKIFGYKDWEHPFTEDYDSQIKHLNKRLKVSSALNEVRKQRLKDEQMLEDESD